MGEFTIEADTRANRLHMELSGSLDADDADAAIAAVERESGKLDDGFSVVNDISEFEPLSQSVADTIADGKRILSEAGAGALVRVPGDSAIGSMQFDRVGDADGYDIATVETVADAEAMLDDRDD
mgnify:CR=1 FL=1